MLALLNDGLFSDVTFVIADVEFNAHKSILSTRCDTFRAMFTSRFIRIKKRLINGIHGKENTYQRCKAPNF